MPRLTLGLFASVALVATALAPACGRSPQPLQYVPGGDPEAGRRAIATNPCVNCHLVPGVRESRGTVGPPLTHFARRTYIGGRLPNRPEYLIQWIQDAPALEPQVAMPDMDISAQDARDIAAYLYTLH